MRLALFLATLCALFAGLATQAAATSNYDYAPNEYAIVQDGLSPDGKYSIAAHGNDQGGNEDFRLYLMAEPLHSKLGPLEGAVPWLDTRPKAFDAVWSQDSQFVALGYRLDRHLYTINHVYRIGDGRAYPVGGPNLVEAMGIKAEYREGVDFQSVMEQLVWLGPGRFRLMGHGTIVMPPELAQTLDKYGKQVKAPEPWRGDLVFFEYNIEAECEIEGDKYKVLSLKP